MSGVVIAGVEQDLKNTDTQSVTSAISISFWWISSDNSSGNRIIQIDEVIDIMTGVPKGKITMADNGASVMNTIEAAGAFSVGIPVHVVATAVEGGSNVLYIDGVLADSGTCTTLVAPITIEIGESGGGTDSAEGEYYDFRLYRRELTAAEVLTIYTSEGKDATHEDAWLRWSMFDESPTSTMSSTDVKDTYGNIDTNASSGTVFGGGLAGIGFRRRTA